MKDNSASIQGRSRCKDCHWPIIHCCCNDAMSDEEPYCIYDYWSYCSNKCCKNHAGEGWEQVCEAPDFCEHIAAKDNQAITNNWISVKERLPDEDCSVLVYCPAWLQCGVAWFDAGSKQFEHDVDSRLEGCYLSHWMPLEPPEEGEHD